MTTEQWLNKAVDQAMKQPQCFEAWRCQCGVDAYAVHPFDEVIACGCCGRRVASRVSRYRDLLNMLPDLRDNGGSSVT